jgi:hypothetical protein
LYSFLAPNPPKSGEKKTLVGVKKKSGEKFVFFCAKWLLLLLALWIIIVSLLFKDGHINAKNHQGRQGNHRAPGARVAFAKRRIQAQCARTCRKRRRCRRHVI